MIDLTQALGHAADAATAARPDIDAGPVLQRIRRRRAVRVAAESTVGVAAAGAVALAGLTLAGRQAPTTPAVPTASAPAGPALVTLGDGALGCGLPVPVFDDPAGDADVHLAATPAAASTADGTVDLSVAVVNGTDVTAPAPASLGPRVLLARDGVVVGGLSVPTHLSGAEPLAAGASFDLTGTWTTAACRGGALTGAALAAGDYDVVAAWQLGIDDVVVGGPWTLTVETTAPEAPADPHPPLRGLTLSTAGLGPLAIGVAPLDNPGGAMLGWDSERCADVEPGPQAGRWVAVGYDDDPDLGDRYTPFTVAVDESDRLTWIDVYTDAARTAQGAGLGTSLAELQALYPDLQGPFEGGTSRVWWLADDAGVLVFETQDDSDGLQPAGTPELVVGVRVLAAGTDPRFATANTDWTAESCL